MHSVRSLLPLEAIPGMISLVAGKPSPETFPIAEIAISLKGAAAGKDRIVVDGEALNQALQYGHPRGNEGLIRVCLCWLIYIYILLTFLI